MGWVGCTVLCRGQATYRVANGDDLPTVGWDGMFGKGRKRTEQTTCSWGGNTDADADVDADADALDVGGWMLGVGPLGLGLVPILLRGGCGGWNHEAVMMRPWVGGGGFLSASGRLDGLG